MPLQPTQPFPSRTAEQPTRWQQPLQQKTQLPLSQLQPHQKYMSIHVALIVILIGILMIGYSQFPHFTLSTGEKSSASSTNQIRSSIASQPALQNPFTAPQQPPTSILAQSQSPLPRTPTPLIREQQTVDLSPPQLLLPMQQITRRNQTRANASLEDVIVETVPSVTLTLAAVDNEQPPGFPLPQP